MAGVYPSLHDKFRSENVCPICMMEMTGAPKYSCEQHHILCHRCKPYYHECPTCRSPLGPAIPPREVDGGYHMPPSGQYMPHPYPPYPPGPGASAPFLEHERPYPPPHEDHDLHACQYSNLGCYARLPEHLRPTHESRCQFRPNLESENLPTDLNVDDGALEDCRYTIAGCNVRLPIWRKLVHEKLCIYKDKMAELEGLEDQLECLHVGEDYDDLEELVDCRFREYGCQVRMPRRRKYRHEERCNHGRHHEESDEDDYIHIRESHDDPDEQLPCRWAEFGCQVQPRRCRRDNHQEKCNYRREHCRFEDYGCYEMLEPARRFTHERNCRYSS